MQNAPQTLSTNSSSFKLRIPDFGKCTDVRVIIRTSCPELPLWPWSGNMTMVIMMMVNTQRWLIRMPQTVDYSPHPENLADEYHCCRNRKTSCLHLPDPPELQHNEAYGWMDGVCGIQYTTSFKNSNTIFKNKKIHVYRRKIATQYLKTYNKLPFILARPFPARIESGVV